MSEEERGTEEEIQEEAEESAVEEVAPVPVPMPAALSATERAQLIKRLRDSKSRRGEFLSRAGIARGKMEGLEESAAEVEQEINDIKRQLGEG